MTGDLILVIFIIAVSYYTHELGKKESNDRVN